MGFLRIPGVSTDPVHAGDVVAAARWVADLLRAAFTRSFAEVLAVLATLHDDD